LSSAGATVYRFACTQCGACCNRSPEVLLSEAAALADHFVFRLMFRLYEHPRHYNGTGYATAFFERKRMLAAFAADQSSVAVRINGRTREHVRYLMITAMPIETPVGMCSALVESQCSIYERRPVACHSVPLHYARPAGSAAEELAEFVSRDGYDCATGPDAPPFVVDGVLVDVPTISARDNAAAIALGDRPWAAAIARRLKAKDAAKTGLPTYAQVVDNAAAGTMTTSMRIAWQIAARIGIIDMADAGALIARQLRCIDAELARGKCSPADHQTLVEMRTEYATALR
jgi:Fe-S-cluster containining protein